MPTPFMHMALAQRLRRDPELPRNIRALLESAWGAFLLGSIAPDARVSSGLDRASTHFFQYRPIIEPPAITAMLREFQELRYPRLTRHEHIAFVCGYAAHLAMDVTWCTDMLFPIFLGTWGTDRERFLLLHVLLGYLDQRDRHELPDTDYTALQTAAPDGWLPFISDSDLDVWRDTVASQLAPGAASRTLDILGERVRMSAAELNAFLESDTDMRRLWDNVTPQTVSDIEARMYADVRSALIKYFDDEW